MRCCIVVVAILSTTLGVAAITQDPARDWDSRYSGDMYVYGKEPVDFLREQIGELRSGTVLDLAAGEGRNAVYLAQQGFDVLAVDVSAKGLEKCRARAAERDVEVRTEAADLREADLGTELYDVVTDFYYHQPDLFPKVMRALKPGGVFILQGFSIDQPQTNRFGPREPAFLIRPNELLRHFASYRIRHYEDRVVDLDEGMHQGKGAVVRLVVEKTPVD